MELRLNFPHCSLAESSFLCRGRHCRQEESFGEQSCSPTNEEVLANRSSPSGQECHASDRPCLARSSADTQNSKCQRRNRIFVIPMRHYLASQKSWKDHRTMGCSGPSREETKIHARCCIGRHGTISVGRRVHRSEKVSAPRQISHKTQSRRSKNFFRRQARIASVSCHFCSRYFIWIASTILVGRLVRQGHEPP